MILKSTLTSIFLLLLWSVFINYRPFSISQGPKRTNLIAAEKYLFESHHIDNVILGSSLSSHIADDSLEGFYNLSLSGKNFFDGFNVITLKKPLPKRVFVEVNMLQKREDPEFEKSISSPVSNFLKSKIKAFRSDRNPLAFMGYRMYLLVKMFSNNPPPNQVPAKKKDYAIKRFEKDIARAKIKYAKPIPAGRLDSNFKLLAEEIAFLESRNVEVIFFEMPINPELIHLQKAASIRDRIQKDFPQHRFIPLPPNMDWYKTNDGVHLSREEGIAYTHYLKEQIEQVLQERP